MSNHVSLNRRGGIFSSVYEEGTVRKGEQIYHRVARAHLCLLDDFYCETVKRQTQRSSVTLTIDIDNAHCFSICSAGGGVAREKRYGF